MFRPHYLLPVLLVMTVVLVGGVGVTLPDVLAIDAVPSEPTDLSATPGNNQVTLSWNIPTDKGSSAITNYIVVYKQSQFESVTPWITFSDNIGTSTTVTVTGLTNGAYYDFKVAASNSVGSGPWARTSATAGIPSAPTDLSATPGNTQVTLSWTGPKNTGGSSIVDYIIQYRDDLGAFTTFKDGSGTTTTVIVTGLSNDTLYEFRVAARNQVNTGSWSDVAEARPQMPAPSAPTGLSTAPGNGYVRLTWDPPSNSDESISYYKVEFKKTTDVQWRSLIDNPTDTTITVTSLTNDISYDFRVAAVNSVGRGSWSTISDEPQETAPSAPTNLSAILGDKQAILSW